MIKNSYFTTIKSESIIKEFYIKIHVGLFDGSDNDMLSTILEILAPKSIIMEWKLNLVQFKLNNHDVFGTF